MNMDLSLHLSQYKLRCEFFLSYQCLEVPLPLLPFSRLLHEPCQFHLILVKFTHFVDNQHLELKKAPKVHLHVAYMKG